MSMAGRLCTCSCSYSTPLEPFISRKPTSTVLLARSPGWQQREHRRVMRALAAPVELQQMIAPFMDHLFLAYERVVFPCQSMNCGDVVYRSTLDPVLRLEQRGLNPQGLALVAAILAYLTATPGVLAGAWDYYVLDKYQRIANTKPYNEDSFILGKKLAAGGFGTVYRGDLIEEDETSSEVVIKKAKEFGEAEVWMNERLMRAAPGRFAEFVTAFEERPPEGKSKKSKQPIPLWLVWKFEGNWTLWNLMQKKDFPYNTETLLFGQELDLPKGPQRSLLTIRLVMLEVLEALKASHATGIVHRDIKPQNVIISETDSRAKLIDMGAAADLRVGINYVPNEFLLDPRYAPPQQYIMSTQTPRAPPVPVAATLSPILWRLNNPDRFDMFSAGIMLLQLIFQPLRSDNSLIAFRKVLADNYDHDLDKWRKAILSKRPSREYVEGFQIADMDGGSMWDLLKQLTAYQPSKRLSAKAALRHPAFGTGIIGRLNVFLSSVGNATDQVINNGWITEAIAKAASTSGEGLTEAQLSDELGSRELPPGLANASKTISWWQQRQVAFQRAAAEKEYKLSKGMAKVEKRAKRAERTHENRSKPWSWHKTSG